jgi:hypothetical protein
MTFGYNATAAFENSVAGIEEHARDLLEALGEVRRDVNVSGLFYFGRMKADFKIGEQTTYNLHRAFARRSGYKTS